MPAPQNPPYGNRLLDGLPPDEKARLAGELERVPLTFKQVLQGVGEPLSHVWFPLSGVASMITQMADGGSVEVATVGREGMVGVSVVLQAREMAQTVLIQIAGEADRIPSDRFQALLGTMPNLQRVACAMQRRW